MTIPRGLLTIAAAWFAGMATFLLLPASDYQAVTALCVAFAVGCGLFAVHPESRWR